MKFFFFLENLRCLSLVGERSVYAWERVLLLICSLGVLLLVAVGRTILTQLNAVVDRGAIRRQGESSLEAVRKSSFSYRIFLCFVTLLLLAADGPLLDSLTSYPWGWVIDAALEVLCEILSSTVLNAVQRHYSLSQISEVLFNCDESTDKNTTDHLDKSIYFGIVMVR